METPKKGLYAAMAKAFPDIEGAAKDKANPHFRSKYADLGNVVDAIKPALAKHGLWFRQATHLAHGGVCVETFICHESGEEISCGQLFVPANKNDAQGYGSALTYCKRYSLQTAFGVAPEDDDGNAASKPTGNVGGPITDTQLHELQDLATEVGADLQKFCQYMRVSSLNDIPAGKFNQAKSALSAKRAQRNAA